MKKLIPLMLITLLFTACSTPDAAPTATPEATEVLTPTETTLSEQTIKSTPTQAPTPTPESSTDSDAQTELNRQIQDFINFDGEFSEAYMIASGLVFTDIEDKPMKFGIYRDDQPEVSAWLFDSYRKEGNDYLVVGLDGTDNERFVTVVEFPTEYMLKVGSGLTIYSRSGTAFKSEYLNQATLVNSEDIYNFFQEVEGSPIKMVFYAEPPSKDLSEYGDLEEDLRIISDRTGLVNRLFEEVADNGFKNVEGLYPETIEDGTRLVRVESVEDTNTLSSNQIPHFLTAFGYIE